MTTVTVLKMLKKQRTALRNGAFKRAIRISVRLGCHNCTVNPLSNAPSAALVAKTPADLMWKQGA